MNGMNGYDKKDELPVKKKIRKELFLYFKCLDF